MADKILNAFDVWITAQGVKSRTRLRSVDNVSLEGVAKLRELILEFAIQGKLVPQNSKDESATILLAKMVKEESELVQKKIIKKSKELPPIEEGEFPFELPKGWAYTRLNNIGEWGAGATPLRGRHDYYGGEIPWFKSGELTGDFISKSEETVTELALKQTSLRYNKAGDVLIAMYGATIGKSSILEVPATTNQAVCACTPFSGVYNVFLLKLLRAYNNRFINMGAGGAQPNISREKIIATVIALPPLAEQHRIVAKVDELMSLCDELEREETNHLKSHQLLVQTLLGTLTQAKDASDFQQAWNKLYEHFDDLFTTEDSIDQLKQTILQLAVMGKLVPQDPTDEPASELLKRIAKAKEKLVAEGILRKKTKQENVSVEEKFMETPKRWEWIRLGDIAHIRGGKRLPTGHSFSSFETPYMYIQVTNMKNGTISSENLKYISQNTQKAISKYIIRKEDLYITIAGTIGDVGIVPEEFDNMNLTENAARITFYEVCREWLQKALTSQWIQDQYEEKTKQVAQPKLALHRIESTVIPLPPIKEQQRIAEKVNELFALCDRLKERIAEAQKVANQMAEGVGQV